MITYIRNSIQCALFQPCLRARKDVERLWNTSPFLSGDNGTLKTPAREPQTAFTHFIGLLLPPVVLTAHLLPILSYLLELHTRAAF